MSSQHTWRDEGLRLHPRHLLAGPVAVLHPPLPAPDRVGAQQRVNEDQERQPRGVKSAGGGPAHGAAAKHVGDERDEAEPGRDPDSGDARDPRSMQSLGLEAPPDDVCAGVTAMANASERATGDMPAAAADVVRQDLPATAGTGAHEAVFQCELTSARSRPRDGNPAVRSEASTPRTTIMLEGTSMMDLTQSTPPRTSRGCGQRPPAGALRSSEHAFDAIRSGAWLTRGTRGHGLADTPEAPQAGGSGPRPGTDRGPHR